MNPTQEMIDMLRDAWTVMVKRLPGSSIQSQDGLATIFANVPLPFFNVSLYEKPISDPAHLDQILRSAVKAGANCPHPWIHILCEGSAPEGWLEVAQLNSLASIMTLTGMATNQLLPSTRALPNLEWKLVNDSQTAHDLAVLNAHAYHMPEELFDCIDNLHIWQADTVGVVGYLDGKPVTAAAALPVNQTMYLALVASQADHRGKGYAEACIREVFAKAQTLMGYQRMTLHASDAGKPLYAAMGFAPITTFALLMPQAA